MLWIKPDPFGESQMDYFWYQQDDIPEGMGYGLFGIAHILSVVVTLALAAAVYYFFFKTDKKKQDRMLKGIPLLMVGLEIFKDLFLVSVHRFGLGYLPLHACSIGVFVFLLREFLPWEKAKAFFGEVAFVIIMPGSLAALIFPDWTEYYPVWNFINLHSYLWHGLLVLYPLLLKHRRDVKPSVKHLHWVLLYLAVVVPPVYAFDKKFGYNYFFVNWPVENSPLSLMAKYMGNPGYLAGYAGLAILVFLFIYLIVWVIDKHGRIFWIKSFSK